MVITLLIYHTKTQRRAVASPPTLQQIIQTVDGVEISPNMNGVSLPEIIVGQTRPGRRGNQAMISILRTSGHFHASPDALNAPAKADFIFYVMAYNGVMYNPKPYDYISKTGELGSDNQWCYVPDKFKVWMQSVKKKLPRVKPPKVIHEPGLTIITQ